MKYKSVRFMDSPLGWLKISANSEGICDLSFVETAGSDIESLNGDSESVEWVEMAVKELGEYFDGQRKEFEVKVALEGTLFQKAVWVGLQTIAYGETRSYKELAMQIGNSLASRAVGNANSANPVAIIVPCHRVIAANGDLGGYSAGLDRKQWLLAMESEGVIG